MTDTHIRRHVLNEKVSCKSFAQNVGSVVELEKINPLARLVA